MPGIFGYYEPHGESSFLADMRAALSTGPSVDAEDYSHLGFHASRRHRGVLDRRRRATKHSEVHVWLEGEVVNLQALRGMLERPVEDFADVLAVAYVEGRLAEVLGQADGYFCACLYDSAHRRCYFVTDRLGMRPLYLFADGERVAWACELKQLLVLPFVALKVDRESVECFLDLGFMLEDRTWFQGVTLIRPSTIVEVSLAEGTVNQRRYWSWSRIRPRAIGFDSAVDDLCDILPRTVERRFSPNKRMGIPLSGGLDSRFIFAAANKLYPGYRGYAYTFGSADSEDVRIAREVARRGGWEHECFELRSTNWFDARIPMVWTTEGMLSVMHLHGAEFLPRVAEKADILLNGYAGDVIAGGGWITSENCDHRVAPRFVRRFYGRWTETVALDDEFYDIEHFEPHVYMNRVRRFTNVGTINHLGMVDHRKPFVDNELMEFLFSITDRFRQSGKLYHAALLRLYPSYFRDIPWQKSGAPIGSRPKSAIRRKLSTVRRVVEKMLDRYDVVQSRRDFTDYDRWIRSPPVAARLRQLLSPSEACYPEHLPGRDFEAEFLSPHLRSRRRSNSAMVLRAATVELFLRRLCDEGVLGAVPAGCRGHS
jgi:asparagine synthetase B (glutamine-hydrolysing)